jgi:uncharacterized membrane protein
VTSPSSYRRRIPAAIIALAGFAIALYLGLDQLGVVAQAWEPFFGSGTFVVLHSSLARLLPVPDALVGAAAYLVEFVLELWGDEWRWRSRPLLTTVNQGLVTLMAVGSLGLVAAQGLVFHAWCTLCLASAVCSFVVFGLSVEEMLALTRHVVRANL